MKKHYFSIPLILMATMLFSQLTLAVERPQVTSIRETAVVQSDLLTGNVMGLASCKTDSIYLLGGPDRDDGDFEDALGLPDWEGWTSFDRTASGQDYWHIDTYNCDNLDPTSIPNHAWWCGAITYPSCGPGDPEGGYGDGYNEFLNWWGEVPDSAAEVTVTLSAQLNYENEPGYDFLYLEYLTAAGIVRQATYNGTDSGVLVSESFTLSSDDYVPHPDSGAPAVQLCWHFTSDGAWSDEDCQYPTAGAAQLDLLTVFFDQGSGPVQIGIVEDCEDPGAGQWRIGEGFGAGDYAKVWPRLEDADPCRENDTPQVAFIDDGIVQPGTGGSYCWQMCYGPGGFVVNWRGIHTDPNTFLNNEIVSPILTWPAGTHDGAELAFDVYTHNVFPATTWDVFYRWRLRSTADPAGEVDWSEWRNNNTSYYGGARYWRHVVDVTAYLVPDCRHVQVALSAATAGFLSWCGEPETVGPYFDNVAFKTFEIGGPSLSAEAMDLPRDGFPANGELDLVNLSRNAVRFDSARNIGDGAPGDSIVLNVELLRHGAVLTSPPELHWRLRANALFDPYRSETPPNPVIGLEVAANCFAFDLPDSSFFFPGDVIHFYCRASSNVGGDIRTTLLPGDTTGFTSFPADPDYSPLRYQSAFVVEALPTVFAAEPGAQPSLLFWQDFKGALENEWLTLFQNLGYRQGVDYDWYRSNAPGRNDLVSLGYHAGAEQLTGYGTIIYSAGDRRLLVHGYSGSGGEYGPDDADIALLDSWLQLADRQLLISGNQLARSLSSSSGPPADFLSAWLATEYAGLALEQLDDQSSPLVKPLLGNSLGLTTEVIAHGGCPDHGQSQQGWYTSLANRRFDAVTPLPVGERILEFTDPTGETGIYSFAAGIYHDATAYGNRIVYLPCEPSYLLTPASAAGDAVSARTRLIQEILTFFGNPASGNPTAVPECDSFTVRCHPNPFNPRVVIECRLPRSTRLTVKIYNLRGQLVKTLLDAEREAGKQSVVWDGVDQSGRQVASGVYFCESRAGAASEIRKLVMVD